MTNRNPTLCSAIIGIGAGVVITILIAFLSKGWWGLNSYNQALMGIGIIHLYVSILLVLFFAGCTIPFLIHTDSRQTILLYAALSGLIAAILARFLPFIGNPAYIISSLLSTVPQLLVFLTCGVLVVTFGGLFASFIRMEDTRGFAPLFPMAIVTIAVIVLPPLCAAAGMVTGILAPAPYSCGPSEQPTDLFVLKLSPGGEPEWKTSVDISIYDRADTLTEYADGYVIATTTYQQESILVNLILFDRERNYSRIPAVRTGYNPISTLVPAPNNGFILATETPEILCIDPQGETVWSLILANQSPGSAPVCLLARDDDTFVAGWQNHATCLTDNGTVLWDATLNTSGRPDKMLISSADAGGILVCTWGEHVFTGQEFEVPLKAVRLDADGTMLWEQAFGTGVGNTLLGVWQNGHGHTILYRTTTSSKDFWGNFVQAHASYLISLSDDGTVTGWQEVADTGGDVITSPVRGYISVAIEDESITMTGYDAGHEIWKREYGMRANPYSLRGMGTDDGGYLIAFSSPSEEKMNKVLPVAA